MIVIFSGFNQRAVIAFVRTLEKNNIDYAIIASSKEDTILKTTYVKRVLSIRSIRTLDLKDILSSIDQVKQKASANKLIISPSTEALNRFMLENKKSFEELNCTIPLVDEELYAQVSDKESFTKLCKDNQIDVPEQSNSIEKLEAPIVAKPKKYMNQRGETHSPVIIKNENEKQEFIKKYDPEEFFYQEYVGGKSLYLLYYINKNNSLFSYAQENLIQQADGKSVVAAVSSDLHLTEVSVKYEDLFKSLNFQGLVMVEVKEHEGKYIMIEANPRFWGPSQLFVDAKNNLFEAMLYDWGYLRDEPAFKKGSKKIRYYWHGGIVNNINEGKSLTYHNYTKKDYESEKNDWHSVDIYNRPDTIEIYKEELSK